MPGFPFTAIEPNQLGQVTKWDVPFNDWIGLKFQNAHEDTFGTALSRRTEDFIWDDDNPAKPEVLNQAYGIPGENGLTFDKPMSAQRARLMHERKRGELERLAYIESASHSWASAKAVAGFGASLVGGMSHPLDLGLAFLPFIGSEKEAAAIAKLGGSAWRQSLARGLISEESLIAAKVPYAKLTGAMVDGIVNQAVAEIPVALQKHRDQAIYGLEDSAFNILAGGAFAGAVKGLGLALERAGKLWRELDPRMQEAALLDTARSILTGDPPRSHWAFGMDEATIRAKVDEKVRAENPFQELKQPRDEVAFKQLRELGITEENAIALLEGTKHPDQVIAEQFSGIRSTTPSGVKSHNEAVLEAQMQARVDIEGIIGASRERGQPSNPTGVSVPLLITRKMESALKEIGFDDSKIGAMTPQQAWDHLINAGYTPEDLGAATKGAVDATREQSINDFLASSKAEYENRIKGMVDAETQKVLDEVKRQTPPMPDAEREKYTFKRTPEDKDITALEQDIANISKEILNMAKTPEERAVLEAEIAAITKEMKERPPSAEKAVDAMIPCVTAKAKS